MTLLSDNNIMQDLLNVLGALVCAQTWTSASSPHFEHYLQHSCHPSTKWASHTVTILFNDGAQTPPLPVTNFCALKREGNSDVLHLQILSLEPHLQPLPNVFGKQFFANQWVGRRVALKP